MEEGPRHATKPPRFSLIIPAHNEEGYLPRLLESVEIARRRCAGGAGAVEVVVADNASTDGTAQAARAGGCRVVREEKRVIAAARNAGARAALGEIFCFIDADSRIHPETFNVIDAAISSGRIVGGSTGVRMERISLGIGVTLALLLPIVWITGIDAGVVFCRREDFHSIGGYNEKRRVAEDVQFLLDLRRLGRRRGQRLTRLRKAKAVASARKFDRHGDWHYLTGMIRMTFAFLFSRRALDAFIQSYWYDARR